MQCCFVHMGHSLTEVFVYFARGMCPPPQIRPPQTQHCMSGGWGGRGLKFWWSARLFRSGRTPELAATSHTWSGGSRILPRDRRVHGNPFHTRTRCKTTHMIGRFWGSHDGQTRSATPNSLYENIRRGCLRAQRCMAMRVDVRMGGQCVWLRKRMNT